VPGVYPFPEEEDVVYGYLAELYGKLNKPVTGRMLAYAMDREISGSSGKFHVEESLEDLLRKGLISWEGGGYTPLRRSIAFRKQLEMEEVEPFTREYGESAESHVDKVWDFRTALTKPEAGGKWGLAPTSHFFYKDRPWKGLTQENVGGEDL